MTASQEKSPKDEIKIVRQETRADPHSQSRVLKSGDTAALKSGDTAALKSGDTAALKSGDTAAYIKDRLPFKFGIRSKLFLSSFVVIVLGTVAMLAYLEPRLRGWLNQHIESEVYHYACLVRDHLEVIAEFPPRFKIDQWTDRFGKSINARVTIINQDGVVIGDSEVSRKRLEVLENHRNRPEIIAAKKHGMGISRRFSTTLSTEMIYIAIPLKRKDWQGVVRVSRPLNEVQTTIHHLRTILLFAACIGLGVALFMNGWASHLFSRKLWHLISHVRSSLIKVNIKDHPHPSHDEVGLLAGTFNSMAFELEQMVAQLAQERDHLDTILEGMSDGLLAIDEQWNITLANSAAQQLLEIKNIAIGQPLIETVRIPALIDLLKNVEPAKTSSVELRLNEIRSKWILVQAKMLKTKKGIILVLHDLTRLRQLEVVRRDFVANVSHELRTPVSVIRANAETLLDGAIDDPESAQGFIEAILRNAERLTQLIADLLDLSRIESGQFHLDIQSLTVGRVARRALSMVEQLAVEKGITLQEELPSGLRAMADQRALEQILQNLLDNALKYTESGGRVVLRAFQDKDQVRIEVSDNGPGIAPQFRDRIFERFFRIDPGRSRQAGGTGLGLAIVKHLVENMNGQVGVDPVTPRGSTFWLAFPITPNKV